VKIVADKHHRSNVFRRLAVAMSNAVGTPGAFAIALAVVLLWAVSGPFAGFSQTWLLVINTCTTVVTFLLVFLIQATQNRESKAIQLKLDELIRATEARNELANVESADDREINALQSEFMEFRKRVTGGAKRRGPRPVPDPVDHEPGES
jgi:low affinity Fe/Cu permease